MMANWTTKDFYNLCWQWIIKNHHRLCNTFGESLMFIIREPLTLSSSICSSDQSFRNLRSWIEEDSMLRILRTKYSIWLNLNCLWRSPCKIQSNAAKVILLYPCLSMPKPFMTMTRDRMELLCRSLMNFDHSIINILISYI